MAEDKSKMLTTYFKSNGQLVSYHKGEVIIHVHEQPASVFLILRGFVMAKDITKNGQSNLLVIHKRRELFPVTLILSDRPNELCYESLSDCYLLKVSRDNFFEHMHNQQEVALEIDAQVMNTFEIYTDRIRTLGFRTARERVISRLIGLVERFGLRRNGDRVIDVPITHQIIADSTALSRETVTREMIKLARSGLIEQQGHVLIVKNYNRLKKELE